MSDENERMIRQWHPEAKPVAAIARMIGLTRVTVYKALAKTAPAA